jgi:hypothetical protein
MLAARQSPDFGLRWLSSLEPEARAEALRRWSVMPLKSPRAELKQPGLRKCPSVAAANGLGAQLEAFARSVRRVG